MAPTPYTPNGKFRVTYVVSGLTHHLDLPVDIVDAGGGVYEIINHQPLASNKSGVQFVDLIWTYMSALYPSSVGAPAFTTFLRSGIAFIPVDSGSATGGPGTNGAGANLGTQLTFTFKDSLNRRQNIPFLETSYMAPGKSITNTTPASFTAIINQMVVSTGSDDWRDFVRSRGDDTPFRFLRWTNALNRKTRRDRGLA